MTKLNFKEHFDWDLVDQLSYRALSIDSTFNDKNFKQAVNPELLSLEMKERVKNIASALYITINKPYPEVLNLILDLLDEGHHKLGELRGFPVWVIADIVERYGLDYPELSLQAIHKITQHFTGEFAILPYLEHYPKLTLDVLQQWTSDPSSDVRRLVSEGIRPRLPWAKKVDWLIEDPSDIFPLLTKLYDDDSEFVRRSVANNLNDISKDHPDRVINCLKNWQENNGYSKNTKTLDWIIRHGCRSLIKQSHAGALELQGYSSTPQISIKQFEIHPSQIVLGKKFEVSLAIHNHSESDEALLIDLELLSPSLNGGSRRRILKWSRKISQAGSTLSMQKKWPIKDTTTRKERTGLHHINLIINGQNLGNISFEVLELFK